MLCGNVDEFVLAAGRSCDDKVGELDPSRMRLPEKAGVIQAQYDLMLAGTR